MPRACILGCAGPRLSADERAFFTEARPFGLILFLRNIENPDQVRALITEFRAIAGRSDAPVLIDQEGGRVQRLRPPHWFDFPPAEKFGALYAREPGRAIEAVRLGAGLIAAELTPLGINVDCMPVADLRLPEGHDVIGDRAYGGDVATVVQLARAAAEAMLKGGVLPVVKHMPGHGRARADSHESLPMVETPLAELDRTDFEVFRQLATLPVAMTAHVVYAAIDPKNPATVSSAMVGEVIRKRIGFRGLLVSDDLSMKALSGSLRSRAEAAIAAGCDIALHCNGRFAEMKEVVEGSPELKGEAARRAGAALDRLHPPQAIWDMAEARQRFSAMIAAA
jgi:beta-N-acetylhexosaminidase